MANNTVLQDLVVKALEDIKAKDIKVIDVEGKSVITDTMVVASGTSSRHVKAIADSVARDLNDEGIKAIGTEGVETCEWVLVDFGDLVLHVMQPDARAYYDLERLWEGDAPESRV